MSIVTPPVTGLPAGSTTSATSNSSSSNNSISNNSISSLTDNFSTFIKILTTQLQNQDPTDATDPNQFTQELVQFASVEQQLNTNSLLQQIASANGAGSVKSLLGYVGQYVEVPANNQLLIQNGQADLAYNLPSAASAVTINVLNSSGSTVATLNGTTNSGDNLIDWNGLDSNGNQLPDGVYTMQFSATDSNGNAITPTSVSLIGQVTGVQTADSQGNDLMLGPNLTVDDANVSAVFSSGAIPSASTSNTSSSPPAG